MPGRPRKEPHRLVNAMRDMESDAAAVASDILRSMPKDSLQESDIEAVVPAVKTKFGKKTRYLDLRKLIGKHFDEFWNFRGRYRALKGSRRSKKSRTAAYWYVIHVMAMPLANVVCLRKTMDTHRRSCFAEIQWVCRRLGVYHLWRFTVTPMEATFIPTGQKIYFLGLDDPLKLSSISTAVGVLCWYWLEEAYEIRNQEVFDMFDEGLAGRVPDGYFKQITLTFNPWSEFWVKTRLFDRVDPSTELYDPEAHKDIWCGTFTYQMNEWLDEADIAKFEDLKVRDPVRYLVAGLGEWGAPEETIYDLTKIRVDRPLNPTQLYIDHPKAVRGIGLDYGFVNIGVAIVVLVDYMTKQLWVLDELIHQGSTNQEIAKQLIDAGYQNWMVVADSAEQKSKLELARSGIYDIHDSRSGPDSIIYGIQYLRQYEMFIDPKCKELIKEISVYQWAVDNETGEKLEKPADYQQDHALDALRYIVAFVQRNYDYGGVSF